MKKHTASLFSNKMMILETLILSLVGSLVAAYLAWTKFANQDPICAKDAVFDCDAVNSSPYSEIYGIPIALLGFLAYLALIVVLILEKRFSFFKENGPIFIFGLSLAGTLYSAYLSYLEAFVIRHWCQYCIVSAVCMTLIFIISIVRLVRQPV